MRIFIKYHQNVIEAITWDRLHVQIIIALLEDYFQINNHMKRCRPNLFNKNHKKP